MTSLFIVLSCLGLALLGWQINLLGSQENAQPADAIVILGAGVNSDGSPGSDLLSRTYHGMDLYNEGLAPVVLCAGGAAGDRLSAAAVACRFAVEELGLPPGSARIVPDADAWTTAQEAAAVAKLAEQTGWSSVILVSHPLHLFRAQWLFEREGLDVFSSPTNTNLNRIFPPLRAWYTFREAGGVIYESLEDLRDELDM
ncbi:MAG: YdcF family protein [Chloroflexota bacterium]|nr:YdcF family protein [Chloroflexota bacterium]